MEYIISKEIEQINKTVITIGNFDGVHLGHQNLIKEVFRLKKDKYNDAKSVVLSFSPHPKSYFSNEVFKLIFSELERVKIFEKLEVDILIEYPFDEQTKSMRAMDFINEILIDKLNCQALVVGVDYGFGKNKEGDALFLKEVLSKKGIEVIIVDVYKYKDEKLGSSRIKKILQKGDIEEVNELLNKPYFILGEVVKGKQLGRQIGFPTMNIYPTNNKLIPPNGVYISKVYIDEKCYNSVTNVGINPTVSGSELVVESHILDFNQDIYGKIVTVEFYKKIRAEKKFNSIDELKVQIDNDVKKAEVFFSFNIK